LTQTIAHPGASDPTGQPEQIKITRTTDQPAPKVERYNSGTQSWEPAGNNDWVKLVNTIRSEEKDTTAITGKAAEHAGNIEDDLQSVREAAAAHPMEMNDDHIPPPPDPFKPRTEPEGPFSKPGGEGTAAPLAKKPEREGLAPPSNPFSFDPCILGTWEATSFRETAAIPITGGTGFRVTFTKDDDGLIETIDYANMQPMRAGNDKDTYTYKGSATARISARDGVAKLEKMQTTGVTWHYRDVKPMKFPDLGPGGLGGTSDSNSYVCTADSLEYHTSTHRDKHANCTVKLTRVK
jgi:hypothetical protein